jgi:hypothetical protein
MATKKPKATPAKKSVVAPKAAAAPAGHVSYTSRARARRRQKMPTL